MRARGAPRVASHLRQSTHFKIPQMRSLRCVRPVGPARGPNEQSASRRWKRTREGATHFHRHAHAPTRPQRCRGSRWAARRQWRSGRPRTTAIRGGATARTALSKRFLPAELYWAPDGWVPSIRQWLFEPLAGRTAWRTAATSCGACTWRSSPRGAAPALPSRSSRLSQPRLGPWNDESTSVAQMHALLFYRFVKGDLVHYEQTGGRRRVRPSTPAYRAGLSIASLRMDISLLGLSTTNRMGRGSHSFTSQLNLSRFGHTTPCPPV